ncbi:Pentatricopeptide repeat-containing protein At3g13160, mitochondrial [Linum perenne]
MATFSRILRRTFSTATAAATTTTTAAEPTVRALSDSLHKERSLKRLVEKFKKSSLEPRFRTKTGIYEDVVRRLASAKCFNWIEEILEDQKRFKDMSKEGFNARLINLYGKAGMFGKAREVFDEMPSRGCDRTTLSFNALLSACLNSKKVEKVEELFKGLSKEMGIQPDVVSYNTLIKAYCDMGSLDSGLEMIKEMEGKGLAPNLVTYNTILHRFYANVKLDDGEKIWGQMLEKGVTPDIRTYNAKLLGLCSAKKMNDAIEWLEEMKKKEINLDAMSYSIMIKGFITADDLEGVRKWYGGMLEAGFKPDKFGYGRLLNFARGKSDFGFAYEVAKDVFKSKKIVDEGVLQKVVELLVVGKMVNEAEEIVKLGEGNGYFNYKLKLPIEV